MLEIILVVYLAKKIGKTAEDKGHKRGKYVFMFVMFWILGEVVGIVAGTFVTPGIGAYLFGILGAALGASIAFTIVNNLSVKTEPELLDQL